jgi:hypothetical protein
MNQAWQTKSPARLRMSVSLTSLRKFEQSEFR